DERARLQATLATLGDAVKAFPASELWINVIYHPHSAAYHVLFKLKLPGETLFVSEADPYLDLALQRGVGELVQKVHVYEQHPDRHAVELAEQRTAQSRDLVAPADPDAGPVAEAVRAGDYRAFRNALIGYEEWLRKRVGRWVQRYPEAEARVGTTLLL